MDLGLKGKIALVTGAASGVGREIALQPGGRGRAMSPQLSKLRRRSRETRRRDRRHRRHRPKPIRPTSPILPR